MQPSTTGVEYAIGSTENRGEGGMVGLMPCEFWAMNDLGSGNRTQTFSCVRLACAINGMFSRRVAVGLLKSNLKGSTTHHSVSSFVH